MMKIYWDIFNKINIKDRELSFEKDYDLKNYLLITDDYDFISLSKKIYERIENNSIKHFIFFENFNLTLDEKIKLLNLFIIKSFYKNSYLSKVQDNLFLDSDSVLNDILELYINFEIYYKSNELTKEKTIKFRGEIFKIIKILILDNIIKKKKITQNNKTLELWSISTKTYLSNDFSTLKIYFEPFKLIAIGENYYLIGTYFNSIQKIFVENLKSEYHFKLNDMNYINNLINTDLYINLKDLNKLSQFLAIKTGGIKKIISQIEANNNLIIETEDSQKNVIMKNNLIVKEYINRQISSYFDATDLINIDLENLNHEDINKFIIKVFYEYCYNFLKKFDIDLKKIDLNVFLTFFYKEFKIKFKNAYMKVEFNDIEELINWRNNFLEFGIDLEELKLSENSVITEINNIPEETIKKKKININKKIDPEQIDIISYILLFTKKEINEILKKNKKKIFKESEKLKLPEYKDYKKEKTNNLNFKEKYKKLYTVLFKYNQISNENFEYLQNFEKFIILKNKKKSLLSENSKLSIKYNVFLLEQYLNKIYSQEKIENIKIYFPFFFDFRGRFYYNSIISPTNNKYCRLIFNYGSIEKEKIPNKNTEVSIIIENYFNKIKYIKNKFHIQEDSIFINETIFWLMISIGKLTMNKNKEEHTIDMFLNNAIFLLENKDNKNFQLDEFDEIELLHYINLLTSLNNKILFKKVLIKDATASFFQNLIRILGSSNEKYEKIANLNNTHSYYDWYSTLLNLWKNKIIKDKNKENIENLEECLKYFTRKTIKKIIMTLPYSSTYPTCLEYFSDSVFENFNKEVENIEGLEELFKNFFSYSNNLMKKKEGPFKKSPDELINHFKEILKNGEEIIIISREKDSTNLTYYKTKTKHFDFIIKSPSSDKRLRIVKNFKELEKNKIDTKKTTTSLRANLVHFVDALLVRDINKEIFLKKKIYYVSIHDSFLVDYTNISEFILIANIQINNDSFENELWKSNKNFFSTFIFL